MAGTQRVDFFSNAAAGNSSAFFFQGGKVAFYAEATFGGGSVKLQFQSPQSTWIDVANGSLTVAGLLILELPAGQYRAVGTTASAIYCSMFSVPTQTTR